MVNAAIFNTVAQLPLFNRKEDNKVRISQVLNNNIVHTCHVLVYYILVSKIKRHFGYSLGDYSLINAQREIHI